MDNGKVEDCDAKSRERGVGGLWSKLNHIAIVVSDVGRSLQFYTDVVGMKQVMRPNFDRHGAWLTFNNVDLHLIKGLPAVHDDDDLIVSHLALEIDDMDQLRERFKELGVLTRKNISVPNPGKGDDVVVDQEFLRDPDGYYIELCNCSGLHEFLQGLEYRGQWGLRTAVALTQFGKRAKDRAERSRRATMPEILTIEAEDGSENEMNSITAEADPVKLSNLIGRMKIYGDIAQTVETEDEMKRLLERFHNDVAKVMQYLRGEMIKKGSQRVVPPAFFERDGTLYQPPPFEIPLVGEKEEKREEEK